MPSLMPLPLRDDPRAPTAKDDRPGCGCLMVVRDERKLALPLRAVSFSAQVAERVAEVTVEQTFSNPYRELLEAVYVFPLPGGAAVSRFELHVGGKKLVGIVEERGEARRQYQVAIAQGKKAAIMEQERDDVFTVKVGNLPPGEDATVKMVYGERLPAFEDGETELRIPLVVAPRYIPGSPLERGSLGDGTESDTTSVPDASRITPPRLAPGLRGEVALAIHVDLWSEGEISDLGCTQHATKVGAGKGALRVALARKDELLDRDFVLRWRTGGQREKPLVFIAKKGNEAFGLLSLVPPAHVKAGAGARDVVFLLDRSGSMQGAKMDSAKRALERLLETLQPQDRFGICAFDSGTQWFASDLLTADANGLARAKRWLARVAADGGTELDPALGETLELFDRVAKEQRKSERAVRLPVVVIVTDGQVGNESEILRRLENRLSGLRVFTLGIDTAVNQAFLRRLAQIGRGTSTFCEPGAGLEDALARIGKEIGTPVLLDVEVEDLGLGLDPASLTPERLPDLFAGRTASVFFRCKSAQGSVRVRARKADGGTFEEVVQAELVEMSALPQLWAKSRVADLEDRYRLAYGGAGGGLEAARGEILALAITHQILTRFTAFLVVDHEEAAQRLELGRRKVVQAVETPAQWADKSVGARRLAAPALDLADPFGAVHDPFGGASADPFAPQAPGSAAPAFAPPPAPRMRGGPPAPGAAAFGLPPGGPARKSEEAFDAFDADDAPDPFAAPAARGVPASGAFPALGGEEGGVDALFETEEESEPPTGAYPVAQNRPAAPPPPPAASRSMSKDAKPPVRRSQAPAEPPVGKPPVSRPAKTGKLPTPPARPLKVVLEELAKALAQAVLALEARKWVADDGALLDRLRDEALAAIRLVGFEHQVRRTVELLEQRLAALVGTLRARPGKPADHVDAFRAASEALAAQCRAELAPLLGTAGSDWEATI